MKDESTSMFETAIAAFARPGTIYGGANEMQRDILDRAPLGTPVDVRV